MLEIVEEKYSLDLVKYQISHYKEIFKNLSLFTLGLKDHYERKGRTFVIKQNGKVLGGYRCANKSTWSLQFYDFAILPEARGLGLGKKLLDHLKIITKTTHEEHIAKGLKPSWGHMMFLDSRVYPQKSEFSLYLKKIGFSEYKPYPIGLKQTDQNAFKYYLDTQQFPHVYRLTVLLDNMLSEDVRLELSSLTELQKKIVLSGLDGKLGHFNKSGMLSYKYEVCPICKDIGSTLEDPKCWMCYLKIGCKIPFKYGFRDDPEVGAIYFSQMRNFLIS